MNPQSRPARHALIGLTALALALSGCGITKKKVKTTPTLGDRVPVLSRIEAGTKVDGDLGTVAVVLPPAEENAEWAQSGETAGKVAGNHALAATPSRAWTAKVAGSGPRQRLAAAPVVGGGKLFVFDTAGEVHAFDAATGAQVWKVPFKSKQYSNSLFGGGVSYDDGKVYVATGLGEVAALNAADGKQEWLSKPAGPLRGAPAIAFGAVYVMTQDNQLVSLDQADGKQVWAVAGASGLSGVFGVAVPAVAQGTVIAGYSTGELTAYRYENGRQLWTDALARTSIATSVSTLTDVDADPIIQDGRVYALGEGGRMAAYDLVSGQRVWELNLAGISTPALSGDWIFVLTDEAKLLCIAKSNGKVRWLAQLPAFAKPKKKEKPIYWTGPVLGEGKLYVASSRGEMMTVDAADGTMTPFTKLGAAVSLAPVVAGKTLFVLDDSGKITAFR